MTDLEMTRLCAEAMGDGEAIARPWPRDGGTPTCYVLIGRDETYDPFHDDAQMVALVKKFNLGLNPPDPGTGDNEWMIGYECARNIDLNRAVVECVAKTQAAKAPH